METFIIILSAEINNAREIAETIENRILPKGFLSFEEVIPELKEVEYLAYNLTNFMDAVNDETLYLNESFISYVHVK